MGVWREERARGERQEWPGEGDERGMGNGMSRLWRREGSALDVLGQRALDDDGVHGGVAVEPPHHCDDLRRCGAIGFRAGKHPGCDCLPPYGV